MQMRQRDVAALDAITKELADAKAENDALRDDVAAGRRRLHIKAIHNGSQCVETTTASGVDNATSPPPDWQTPLNETISPLKRADHYAKTTGKGTQVY